MLMEVYDVRFVIGCFKINCGVEFVTISDTLAIGFPCRNI